MPAAQPPNARSLDLCLGSLHGDEDRKHTGESTLARQRLCADDGRHTLAFLGQQFHLIPYLSALDNILAPALAMDIPGAGDRAMELIEHFGLKERMRHVPAELSIGERQRTAMARALLNRPKLILADEPTGNLDQENAEALLGYLVEYAEMGGSVLLVTHDPLSVGYAQRILRLEKGRLQ